MKYLLQYDWFKLLCCRLPEGKDILCDWAGLASGATFRKRQALHCTRSDDVCTCGRATELFACFELHDWFDSKKYDLCVFKTFESDIYGETARMTDLRIELSAMVQLT